MKILAAALMVLISMVVASGCLFWVAMIWKAISVLWCTLP